MCLWPSCLAVPHRAGLDEMSVASRSWRYLSGQQLDCFTCTPQDASEGSLEEVAPVPSLTATSADGGVPPASAVSQSDAAKHDLGDDDVDAVLGEVMSPPHSHVLLTRDIYSVL